MNYKKIIIKIFNWGKKEKFLSLILFIMFLIFCIGGIRHEYNILRYGNYKYIGRCIPKVQGKYEKSADDVKAVSLKNHIVIFFTKHVDLDSYKNYKIYSLNTETKKVMPFKTILNVKYITYIKQLNNKIYLVANEEFSTNLYAFDYNTSSIKKLAELSDSFQLLDTISLNNNKYILFKYEKTASSDSTNYIYKLYNPQANVFISLDGIKIEEKEEFIGQLNNGNILTLVKDTEKYSKKFWIKITDFKLKTTPLKILDFESLGSIKPEVILLSDNKFIVVLQKGNGINIKTYLITKDNTCKLLAEKEVRNNWLTGNVFTPKNHIVLNDDVFFSGGREGYSLVPPNPMNTTFMYSYSNNELKRITNLPFKTTVIKLLKISENSFIVYDCNVENHNLFNFIQEILSSIFKINYSNNPDNTKVYKFTYRR